MTDEWLVFIELHVVGGGEVSLPRRGGRISGPSEHLLSAARRRGLRTLVVTRDPGFYDRAHLEVDEWLVVDSSSAATVVEELREREGRVRGVTSAVDNFVGVAAAVARCLGLPGPDPLSPAVGRDKGAVRQALSDAGVEHVAHQVVEASSTDVAVLADRGPRYPLVAKPVDGAASWDVALVHDPEQLRDVMSKHLDRDYGRGVRPRRRFVLEEYLEGPVFSVEGMIDGGQVEVFGYSDRVLGAPPSFVELAASFDVDAPHPDADAYVQEVLRALGYTWGPFHVEVVETARGLRLIEVNARLMGAGMQHAVRASRARTWADRLLDLLLGAVSTEDAPAGRRPSGVPAEAVYEITFTAPARGRLVGVDGLDTAPATGTVIGCGTFLPLGAVVEPRADDNSDRFGHVITSGADRVRAKSAGLEVLAALRVDMAAPDGTVRSWPVGDEVRTAVAASADLAVRTTCAASARAPSSPSSAGG